MGKRHGQAACAHSGYHSGIGVYSRESKEIRYVLVCDECGEEMRLISTEPYVPNPVFKAA